MLSPVWLFMILRTNLFRVSTRLKVGGDNEQYHLVTTAEVVVLGLTTIEQSLDVLKTASLVVPTVRDVLVLVTSALEGKRALDVRTVGDLEYRVKMTMNSERHNTPSCRQSQGGTGREHRDVCRPR